MEPAIPRILELLVATTISLVGLVLRAQSPESIRQSALVALTAATGGMTRPIVIVPDSEGNLGLARQLAAARSVSMRSSAEGRSCRGFIPQCTWRTSGDTIAVRVQPRSATAESVIFTVEFWGIQEVTNQQTGRREGFFQRVTVTVAKTPQGWFVVSYTVDFET
jgi:hypothetical protein